MKDNLVWLAWRMPFTILSISTASTAKFLDTHFNMVSVMIFAVWIFLLCSLADVLVRRIEQAIKGD